jgi:hypothetical protein
MIVPGFGDGRSAWKRVVLPHGTHHEDGIFIAVGDGIRAGSVASADICDVAPTVLQRLGGPLPSGLDGRPIPAIGGPAIEERAIDIERPGPREDAYSPEEEREIVERLRGLGYMD